MFQWTEEQLNLREMLVNFSRKELAPQAVEVDENEGFNRRAFLQLGSLGLLGVTASEKFGGSSLGCVEATIVMEELSFHCASTALSYLAHTILCVNNIHENASDEQKQQYLPKLITGEWIGGMGMTEPNAGSDALSLSTQATLGINNSEYNLRGTKTFITNGPIGNIFVVYARTGKAKKEISTFIVESSFPGFRVGKKLRKYGMRGSPTSELIFENCRVPLANRVGRENDSVTHMMRNLNLERITISGIALGIARSALSHVVDYVRERYQFGKTLSEFQMVQERIAEMSMKIDAATALVYAAANAYDRGEKSMSLGAKAKLMAAQMATSVTDTAIQLLGGYGYMKEYPVERMHRDAKLIEIGAGTNEIMRIIIARDLLEKTA